MLVVKCLGRLGFPRLFRPHNNRCYCWGEIPPLSIISLGQQICFLETVSSVSFLDPFTVALVR